MVEAVGVRKHEIVTLGRRHRGKLLALFSSALREDFDPDHSDLDFVVEFSGTNPEQHAAAYFGLLENLEALFGWRVNLVETRAVRNPYLRREIEDRKQILVGSVVATDLRRSWYEA